MKVSLRGLATCSAPLRRATLHSLTLGCLISIGITTTGAFAAQLPSDLPTEFVGQERFPAVDTQAAFLEDVAREARGLAPRFALPNPTFLTLANSGTWENLDSDTLLWRLRISAPNALSLNLGFTRFHLPADTHLVVSRTGQSAHYQSYDSTDNAAHGELWTPVVLAADLLLELTVPVAALDRVELELTSVNVGYRYFGEKRSGQMFAGACNVDVVCPEGDPWRDSINSVGVISTGGSTFCTGFMVNNTAEDEKPYFMTAAHCGISSGNAASLVVYWNFQSPTCGQQGGGSLSNAQTGSFFRAAYSTSDVTLVELDSDPDPAWEVTFAGWDNSGANATNAVAIHHPNTDEKSISFESAPTTTTSYLGTSQPGNGSHVRVEDWDIGTTEPGSSGSPLFDQNHRVIGQLHGGYAACSNDDADWYGKFSVSWNGGGTNSTRLSNWLDPLNTGSTVLDVYNPWATGLGVLPSAALSSQGDAGGPFSPTSKIYTLENRGTASFNYTVSVNQSWVDLSSTGGSLAPGAMTSLTVSINSNANSLGIGLHQAIVSLTNTTTGEGDTSRFVALQVGIPQLVHSFPMNTNPGWTTEGQWAFGQPTGGGGEHGNNDPVGGHTGPNVYGYNLNGDYTNNMPERHLTSGAIDCSNLSATSLKFWRHLNVEIDTYDHAYVRVSNNGTTWTTIWENGPELTDSSWTQVEYDISAIADGQSTVYLRWTQGTTDSSWLYSGWNIDDVEIWGLLGGGVPPTVYCTSKLSSSGCLPQIAAVGTASASASSGFTVSTSQVEINKSGLYFYSTTGPNNVPFQGGTLCQLAPFTRTNVMNSGSVGGAACTGSYSRDLNATGVSASIGAGNQAWMQTWFRDPASGSGTGLSDAVTFTVVP